MWGDHPPAQPGALYADVDAVAETDYSGWYDSPQDSPSQLAALLRSRLRAMDGAFAGKVLVISEFGAESNNLNPRAAQEATPTSRGSSRPTSPPIARTRTSARCPPGAAHYPLVPTFEGGSIKAELPNLKLIEGINQKGLFTSSGDPKPAAAVVARLFHALPAG